MSDDPLSLDEFNGLVRLFPLPNLVLFPFVVQPLHIFEPRYRQMMADALDGDRLLSIVLLKPGWEEDYHLKPAIHSVACVGRIVKEELLPDGRYNLLLHGLARARIIEEMPSDKLYRTAQVELLQDVLPASPQADAALREQMARVVPAWFVGETKTLRQVEKWLASELPTGTLADVFAFALPLPAEFKQGLLEEVNVQRRVERLLEGVANWLPAPPPALAAGRRFPPDFSPN